VDHLQTFFKKHTDVAVVFIYCNYKEQTDQTASNLIASLLKQIVQDCPAVSDNVRSFYTLHQRQGTRPILSQLITTLRQEIESYSKVFIITDALDECTEAKDRAILLRELRSLSPLKVNLLVTSRKLQSIEEHFMEIPRLDIRADDEDVKKFVEGELEAHLHLRKLKGTIVSKIIEKAAGMQVSQYRINYVLRLISGKVPTGTIAYQFTGVEAQQCGGFECSRKSPRRN
jgi:hypothetical protein